MKHCKVQAENANYKVQAKLNIIQGAECKPFPFLFGGVQARSASRKCKLKMQAEKTHVYTRVCVRTRAYACMRVCRRVPAYPRVRACVCGCACVYAWAGGVRGRACVCMHVCVIILYARNSYTHAVAPLVGFSRSG